MRPTCGDRLPTDAAVWRLIKVQFIVCNYGNVSQVSHKVDVVVILRYGVRISGYLSLKARWRVVHVCPLPSAVCLPAGGV